MVVSIYGTDGRLGCWGGRNHRFDRTGSTAEAWAVSLAESHGVAERLLLC